MLLFQKTWLSSQHEHGVSQSSVTPTSGEPMSSSGFYNIRNILAITKHSYTSNIKKNFEKINKQGIL